MLTAVREDSVTKLFVCLCFYSPVVRSRNPCAIGSLGIVIAEKQQVLQICTPANKIISKVPCLRLYL